MSSCATNELHLPTRPVFICFWLHLFATVEHVKYDLSCAVLPLGVSFHSNSNACSLFTQHINFIACAVIETDLTTV